MFLGAEKSVRANEKFLSSHHSKPQERQKCGSAERKGEEKNGKMLGDYKLKNILYMQSPHKKNC